MSTVAGFIAIGVAIWLAVGTVTSILFGKFIRAGMGDIEFETDEEDAS